MNELKQGVYTGATAEMVEHLLEEFLEDTRDTVAKLSAELHTLSDLAKVRRFIFDLKGRAHNFELSNLATIAQRAENYLTALGGLSDRIRADIAVYLDAISDVLDGTIPADENPAKLVRDLPARPSSFNSDEIEVREVEVMLVMLHGAQTHFVEREMQACGYRVSIVTSPFAAFEQVVRTKPDMVVVSTVMPGLSGIDLVSALAAMPETRNIPVAVITSLEPGHEQLKLLPKNVPVIHKGGSFGDDLVQALDRYFLL